MMRRHSPKPSTAGGPPAQRKRTHTHCVSTPCCLPCLWWVIPPPCIHCHWHRVTVTLPFARQPASTLHTHTWSCHPLHTHPQPLTHAGPALSHPHTASTRAKPPCDTHSLKRTQQAADSQCLSQRAAPCIANDAAAQASCKQQHYSHSRQNIMHESRCGTTHTLWHSAKTLRLPRCTMMPCARNTHTQPYHALLTMHTSRQLSFMPALHPAPHHAHWPAARRGLPAAPPQRPPHSLQCLQRGIHSQRLCQHAAPCFVNFVAA